MARYLEPMSAEETDREPPSTVTEAEGPRSELIAISRDECVELLSAHSFGRLAVNGAGASPPVIRPVNYRFDARLQAVVFRSASGSKFHLMLRSANAAFEVDGIEEASRTGWSVIVQGVIHEVTSPSDVRRLDGAGLAPWAPGPMLHWMQIRA